MTPTQFRPKMAGGCVFLPPNLARVRLITASSRDGEFHTPNISGPGIGLLPNVSSAFTLAISERLCRPANTVGNLFEASLQSRGGSYHQQMVPFLLAHLV